MAITISNRTARNYNAPDPVTGLPRNDQYLDFIDEHGVVVATLNVPASSDPTFAVDGTDLGSAVVSLSLLGPFHITYQTVGINGSGDGALLTELDPNTAVIQAVIHVTTGWEASVSSPVLDILIGGPDYQAPDDDYVAICRFDNTSIASADPHVSYNKGFAAAVYGLVGDSGGAVLAQTASDDLTAGVADVYLLVST